MDTKKVDNAVILAAGFSSRFVPVCFDIPKALIPLRGETLIERQIRQLKEIGISDITVVTGYAAAQFNFLREKHVVRLVHNKDYASKNNFASIYAARDYLGDTVISSSDLYFAHNIFQATSEHAYYAAVFVDGETNQRCLTLDDEDKIIATRYGGRNTWITFGGQARFSRDVSKALIDYIAPVYDNAAFANKYWVDFQDAHLEEMPMYIKRIDASDIVEFNSLSALRSFDPSYRSVSISPTMKELCDKHKIDETELTDFTPIKEGNESIGCRYKCRGAFFEYKTKSKV